MENHVQTIALACSMKDLDTNWGATYASFSQFFHGVAHCHSLVTFLLILRWDCLASKNLAKIEKVLDMEIQITIM